MWCEVSMSETTSMSPAVARYPVEAGGAPPGGGRNTAPTAPARLHTAVGRGERGAGDEERQDELASVEAPRQQHPGAEDQPGRDGRQCRERVPERRRPERHHGAQEQEAARQDVREEPVQLTAAGI